ncbi:hypothetical protein WNY51_05875 [Pseudocolwellia sp. AS88]|jgi:hypothetical protein|uniref:hypothetical protein n=1 Tax=Pseudocolwellia TaxID=2848177 RepID=UPI0026EDB857|nr:hypothetical protein [Pseudocolwellia sp. AS88]MDO7083383.1 hypothetical protein [Pseudocolwellia sp. AS88]
MSTSHSDQINYDEEMSEFSAFEMKENSKKRDKRRNTKIMKKQQRLNKDSEQFEDYNIYGYEQ